MKRILRLFPLFALLFSCILLPFPAHSAGRPPDLSAEQLQPGGDHPLGRWDGLLPKQAVAAGDRLWSLRTGFRKGVLGQDLAEENRAGPDVAVLRSGFFLPWSSLLASFREQVTLVDPDELAGLSATQPALIIPSGGLAGLASSAFFRAGLAEYVSSGGVVLCFSQQRGADLSALPVPADGKAVTGAGWSEDSGPLFGASTITRLHPALAGQTTAAPAIETDGYIAPSPGNARVLLARRDGNATLTLYPVDKGWVAVISAASDLGFEQGTLSRDEQTLVRDLVLWAKSGGRISETAPGSRVESTITVRGPETGSARSVRITVAGPMQAKPGENRVIPLDLKVGQETTVPFTHTVPADARPGIYHLEYQLLGESQRPLSPVAEAPEGWFSVFPVMKIPPPPARAAEPLPSPAVEMQALPSAVHSAEGNTLKLELSRTKGAALPRELIVRIGEEDHPVTVSRDPAVVSFEIGKLRPDRLVIYSVRQQDGRIIARGATTVSSGTGVSVDRPWYIPGQQIRASVSGLGAGTLTITGLGSEQNDVITGDRVIVLPVAEGLPSGSYDLTWSFRTTRGERQEGIVPVMIKGASVACTAAAVVPGKDGRSDARLTLVSASAATVQVILQLSDPGSAPLPLPEKTVALAPGRQDLSLPFVFTPDRAGIWSLLYTISSALPDAPGLGGVREVLAAGRVALDAGDAAVIGMRTERPVYYDADVPASVTTFVYGRAGERFELRVDGKRERKEKLRSTGVSAVTVSLDGLKRGHHMLSAAITGRTLTGTQELGMLYGARLADLAVVLQTSDPVTPVMEIGVGITNQGKVPSGHVMASLYEGDPGHGGTLIQTAPVPPLQPGKQHVFIVRWPLAGKAGSRRIYALADPEGKTLETTRSNNSASIAVEVPDVLVTLRSSRPSYPAEETKAYSIAILNFTAEPVRSARLDLEIGNPSGMFVSRETVTLQDLVPGVEQTYDRVLGPSDRQEGTYLVRANLVRGGSILASDSLGITVEPTMLLAGSLDGTPDQAAPCGPLTIRYAAHDAGNVPPINGTLRIEIRTLEKEQTVYAKQLPFVLGPGTFTIDRISLANGKYTIILSGSAVNSGRDMRREYVLAHHALTVAGPVEVTRSVATFPRVLIWSGGNTATTIEQALGGKIVREAFQDQPAYWKTVDTAARFRSEALTGLFNTYVLFEVHEIGDTVEILKNGLSAGLGVIIIGSGEHSRSLAESLGFRFSPGPGGTNDLAFPSGTPLGISGTVPVTGSVLSVTKEGSRIIALFPGDRPAARIDESEPGKIIVAPFSLIHSALDAGASMPYSLLLRAAVRSVAPEKEPGAHPVSPVRLLVSAPAGPVKARIQELLPPGAVVVWMSVPGTLERGTITFEVRADQEPRTILYLIRAAGPSPKTASSVFYECEGKFVNQGKVE